MADEKRDKVPASFGAETAMEVAALVSSAVPWVGGPISNVLAGISTSRKIGRVKEVLEGLVEDLREFRSEVSEDYVKSEEFEELLEHTLHRVAAERNEEKRLIYRDFLVGIIKSPGEPYDEQLRFLRTLEDMGPDHIEVLRALVQKPDPDPGMTGSRRGTLSKRLAEIAPERIEELVSQLNDMRVTNLTSLRTMMTAQGAENLGHAITPFGRRFLHFIRE